MGQRKSKNKAWLRYLFPTIFGLGGAVVLVMLSLWQIQRLEWKQGRIAEIEARIDAAPIPVPAKPDPTTDRYIPVTAQGVIDTGVIHVLSSIPRVGPGYREIVPLKMGDRRILLDRGFLKQADKDATRYHGELSVMGHLDWPRERNSYTPEPDLKENIWFAREVDRMASYLGAEPVMIVAAEPTGSPSPLPQPVSPNLPNNHLQYAITWALLAVVWLAMTGYLVLRIRRRTV